LYYHGAEFEEEGKGIGFRGKNIELNAQKSLGSLDVANLVASQLNEEEESRRWMDWILPNFSTTRPRDLNFFAIMAIGKWEGAKADCKIDVVEEEFGELCGLPEVTLSGTVSDWQSVRQKLDTLLEFDNSTGMMKKWHGMLGPILVKLIETAEGKPDYNWWNQICEDGENRSDDHLGGWLAAFNVFGECGSWIAGTSARSLRPRVLFKKIVRGGVSVNVTLVKEIKFRTSKESVHLAANLIFADISEDNKSLTPRRYWKATKVKAPLLGSLSFSALFK